MTSKPITRKPDGPYLIESSPNYPMRLAELRLCSNRRERPSVPFLERMVMLPFVIFGAATDGYRNEMRHMIDARPVRAE